MRRDQLMHLVDTTMGSDSPSYALLGDGIASLTEEFNAEVETKHWINQKDGTSTVNAYTPSFNVEREDCIDDDTRTFMKMIINELPTGNKAETYVVRVEITDDAPVAGKAYEAYRRKYAVSAVSIGGDAGEDVTDAVNFSGVGDQVKGTFVVDTGVFTPDGSTPTP